MSFYVFVTSFFDIYEVEAYKKQRENETLIFKMTMKQKRKEDKTTWLISYIHIAKISKGRKEGREKEGNPQQVRNTLTHLTELTTRSSSNKPISKGAEAP